MRRQQANQAVGIQFGIPTTAPVIGRVNGTLTAQRVYPLQIENKNRLYNSAQEEVARL
jgi:hypothetical protein